MIISVIGGNKISPETSILAERLGAELARKGAVVVCGGRYGVMEAVCKGAHQNGGVTVGILPSDSRKDANPYVDIPLPTGLGIARNVLVVKAGEAVIALDGEYGTLSEIAIALASGIPVISLGRWKLPDNLPGKIISASSPQDAVEKAIQSIKS